MRGSGRELDQGVAELVGAQLYGALQAGRSPRFGWWFSELVDATVHRIEQGNDLGWEASVRLLLGLLGAGRRGVARPRRRHRLDGCRRRRPGRHPMPGRAGHRRDVGPWRRAAPGDGQLVPRGRPDQRSGPEPAQPGTAATGRGLPLPRSRRHGAHQAVLRLARPHPRQPPDPEVVDTLAAEWMEGRCRRPGSRSPRLGSAFSAS
jgi:hypothetical protein